MVVLQNRAKVNIKWIDSETVTRENAAELLGDVSGILVPGGFGSRGIDGKIYAIEYARTHQDSIPWSLPWYAAFYRRICKRCGRFYRCNTVKNLIHPPHIR